MLLAMMKTKATKTTTTLNQFCCFSQTRTVVDEDMWLQRLLLLGWASPVLVIVPYVIFRWYFVFILIFISPFDWMNPIDTCQFRDIMILASFQTI